MEPQITILYGSQTGNAEDLSKRIGRQVKNLGLRVTVKSIDDFDLKKLPKEKLVIFVCSTTGHGQEPENMKNLYNFIRRRDLPKTCLSDLKFVVYGLGDSSYAKFNYVSKILFKRLVGCGAKPLQNLVLGDEQHAFGVDGEIYPKLEELFSIVREMFQCSPAIDSIKESSYQLQLLDEGGFEIEDHFKTEFFLMHNMATAYCISNLRVTPETHFQDTRLICLKTETNIPYEPGDVCSILPTNSDSNTLKFIEILQLNPMQRIKLTKRDANYMVNYLYDYVPDMLKLKDLVKYYLDIQSVPKRSFFEYLHLFSSDDLEREKLEEFATTAGQEEVYEYCIQPKRSILEVLQDFPNTCKSIRLEFIFDIIPPIKPRSFSIASFSGFHPNEIQLLVGVVKYKTRLKKIREGLCSNYLADLKPNSYSKFSENSTKTMEKLRLSIKRSSFKLPISTDLKPIIMIGPGLGIAPFRSFIESLAKSNTLNYSSLYFGCRYQDADYYFRDELERYRDCQGLMLNVAFSRQEPKQYVQDLILESSVEVRNSILYKSAYIYVAGNSKLPEDLRKTLTKILVESKETQAAAVEIDKIITSLEQSGRLLYDCW